MLQTMAVISVILVICLLFWGISKFDAWNQNRVIGEPPVVGEVWRFKGRNDPWERYPRYTIVDVLDGWVKHQTDYGYIDTCRLSVFTRNYERIPAEALKAEPLPIGNSP